MIIHDLEISELTETKNIVFGGNSSSTSVKAVTSPDSAYSVASGVAVGDKVFTKTKTLTISKETGFSTINFAFASAEAGAKNNKNSSFSSSTGISSNFS